MRIAPAAQRLISKFTDAPKFTKVAVAVSGGCDSVAMLLLLREWCRMKRLGLCVFHVDHSLRETAEDDARWVAELAENLGIEFYSRKATQDDLQNNTELGGEGWARHFRYSSFAEMVDESGADLIATGHNAEDQVETVFMRLLRGSSWQGLCGIRSAAYLNFGGKKLKLWRPILNIHRKELEKYLVSIGQDWRTDETNNTNLYLRNKIRHILVPELEKIQKEAVSHISELGADAYDIQKYLAGKAERYLSINAVEAETVKMLKVGRIIAPVLRREIIRLWLVKHGLSNSITRALIARIDDLWKHPFNGKTVSHRKFSVVWRKKRLWLFM